MIREIRSWFSNIRFYVLVFSVVLSIVIYLANSVVSHSRGQLVDSLVAWYAYTAVVYLFLAVLAGPFTKIVKNFPWRGKYLKARRAIGVSAFYFAVLHVRYTFFDVLGGPLAVLNLPLSAAYPVMFGEGAFIILFLMAITSFDKAVEKMTFERWKRLHRLVYVAVLLVVVHVTLLGGLLNKISLLSFVFYGLILVLLIFHLWRLYLKKKMS